MSVHVIRMPDLGEGIAEVELVAWHVKPGDTIEEDQVLADVMTDKATVEIPSPVAGTVASLGGEVGAVLAVGADLIRIDTASGAEPSSTKATEASPARPGTQDAALDAQPLTSGASPPLAPDAAASAGATLAPSTRSASAAPAAVAPAPASASTPASAPARAAAPSVAATSAGEPRAAASSAMPAPSAGARPAPSAPASASGVPGAAPRKVIASPAVRARAWELGIDLASIEPSGTAGRVMHADLDGVTARSDGQSNTAPRAAAPPLRSTAKQAPAQDAGSATSEIRLIGLRRRIAQKMQDSKRRIPHYAYVEEVDVTELEALREALNARHAAQRGRLTVLPLLIRAIVNAIPDFPEVNAVFDDEAGVITRHTAVHVGIATQTDAGLMVPVLRNAGQNDLWQLAEEIGRLAEAARSGKAVRNELTGSTITITSLGKLGGIASTPVINHPEVAIVGVNKIMERPMVRDGTIVIRRMMNLSSSFDHRVVDGAQAAAFIQRVREVLERPGLLFID